MTVSKLTPRRIDRFPNLSLTLRGVIFEDTCCHESILPVVLANCFEELLNPFTAKFSRKQISTKFPHFILWNFEKQIAPCVSTGRELSFEWSHHRISSTDSNVRATLQNSIKYSGSERVKKHYIPFNCCTCTVFELRMHHKTRKSSRLFQSHKMHQ